jgi:hypothetical protein
MTETKNILHGYGAFLNSAKIRAIDDPAIRIDEDASDSLNLDDDLPSPSIRPTSPPISIASAADYRLFDPLPNKEQIEKRVSPPQSVRSRTSNHSHNSRRSHRSHRSHKSHRSTHSAIIKNKDIISKPAVEENLPRAASPTPSVRSVHSARSVHSDHSTRSKKSNTSLPPIYEKNSEAERLLKYQLDRRREKLYNQAIRLRERYGIRFSQPITPDMTIKDLEEELALVRRNRKIDRNIAFASSTLTWSTKFIEWAAAQTDFIDLHGWSEELRRDMPEICEIMEDLHETHEEAIDKLSSPLGRLGMIWIGGAFKIAASNALTSFAGKMKDDESELSEDPEFEELKRQAEGL